jgi:hypothetical protein
MELHDLSSDTAIAHSQKWAPTKPILARRDLALAFLVFLLAAAFIWPLFEPGYKARWFSIESTFIADGRYLKEHWPHPRWQPLWYCGTRFDYIYPPALRYGVAGISRFFSILPVQAYHIYTAFFYAAGIAAVFTLIVVGSGSRGAAWLGAIAAACISPSFLFLTSIRNDAVAYWPQRLHALISYGEGPHITALSILPFALASAWIGLRRGRVGALVLAAVLSALVVSNNFYGATALAIFFAVLVWALWITHQDHWMLARAAAIGALAYGLAAFWLVPSYVSVTLRNMKYVSDPGNSWSIWVALAVAAVFAAASWMLARNRPERAWIVFVCGAGVAFGLNALGYYYFNFRVIGFPSRLIPELDLAFILLGLEGLRRLWVRGKTWRIIVAFIVVASFWFPLPYLRHPWSLGVLDPQPQKRIEYRISEWMAKNMPEARAFATGSVRFWYNAWFDLSQIGGGSEQGLQNELVMPAYKELANGDDPELGRHWLLALGADAIIVHDKNSSEFYHDIVHPNRFRGVLPVAWESGEGDTIYRVPRRPGLARVVDAARAASLKTPAHHSDRESLKAYADLVETSAEANMRWESSDEVRIRAQVGAGQSVLLMTTYDPAWRAYAGKKPLPIRKDAMNFMLIDAPAGEQDIRVVFELPLENAVGRLLTAASVLIISILLFRRIYRSGGRDTVVAALRFCRAVFIKYRDGKKA